MQQKQSQPKLSNYSNLRINYKRNSAQPADLIDASMYHSVKQQKTSQSKLDSEQQQQQSNRFARKRQSHAEWLSDLQISPLRI